MRHQRSARDFKSLKTHYETVRGTRMTSDAWLVFADHLMEEDHIRLGRLIKMYVYQLRRWFNSNRIRRLQKPISHMPFIKWANKLTVDYLEIDKRLNNLFQGH